MKISLCIISHALLLAGLIFWASACNLPPAPKNDNAAQQNARTDQRAVSQRKPDNWQYTKEADKMGRGSIRMAATVSVNTVSFGFPYQGDQHGILTIREHPQHGRDVILSIEKGQFLTGVFGCKVFIRFDDANPLSFSANEPSDYGTTTLFINGYSRIVPSLKRSKKVMIEAPFYQEGNRVFEFNVDGLEWENPESKKAK